MAKMYQKKLFIKDLLRTEMLQKEIKEIFYLSKSIATVTNGSKSLSLRFIDRDGDIAGRMWQETIKNEYIGLENVYVFVTANVGMYEGIPTLYVTMMEPIPKDFQLDVSEFAKTLHGINELYEEFIKTYKEEIKKPHCVALLDKFYLEPAFAKRFKETQGGKAIHHVVRGGYVQHTYSVFEYCIEESSTPQENELRSIRRLIKKGVLPANTNLDQIKEEINRKEYLLTKEPFHENFDRDILLTAAALQDLGMVKEYKPLPANQRTDEGIMLGHVALTLLMVNTAMKDIEGFTKVEELKLLHCLLTAHNGSEDGQIIDKLLPPMCVEAQILSQYDEHDARRDSFNGIIKSEIQSNSNTTMTKYYQNYYRSFYKK